jgi:hypothetical protein
MATAVVDRYRAACAKAEVEAAGYVADALSCVHIAPPRPPIPTAPLHPAQLPSATLSPTLHPALMAHLPLRHRSCGAWGVGGLGGDGKAR